MWLDFHQVAEPALDPGTVPEGALAGPEDGDGAAAAADGAAAAK